VAVDYAKKQPPKRKPAAKKRKSPAAKPRGGAKKNNVERPSIGRVVLTLLLLVGFVSLLVWLKVKDNSAPVPASGTAIEETPLPEMPKEEWSYIEELENKEVEVVVPERAESAPRVIQCGSFRTESDAEAMRAQIAFIGLEAQIRATEGSNGLWYRVVLGPFENQRVAQSTNHQLQRGGMHGCQIWNWTFD